ncbi:ABC transporter [Mediterraneibacter butyricigenes]|uniref:ABC transporter n=1 Tax=Mediterraneibacter butyricigenes TaxID=2316025 RepID=A0A391PDB9_9FIRM|nr:ABC transporter ATP-binding protein [Mediterraneibacter butyricigenes]RGV98425.1 ABC transporter ATP-binding protein [Ruminococcus sp. AF14-10]GCA67839.1 ABC transporter [Mediterraneibacter butyricigenes]
MREPILEMKGITKTFGSVTANENVDLTLYPGEIHALLGENGAGKSTLMNVLNGIYRPNSGEILHKGKKVTIRSPKHAVDMGIGMVHQHFRLIPTLTAAENVFLYMPKCNLVLKKKEMEEQIRKWSEEFHLEVEPSALIWQLSVGEQQRVEIVKLLSRGAEILILDEPSAVLTAQEAKEMFRVLRSMADSGKSVVVISHKMNEVMEFADRITVLKGGKVEDTMVAADATVERLTRAVVGERELKPHKNEGGSRQENVVLDVKDLSVKNDRELMAVKNLSIQIHAGEIFGIAGVAGNGQKELAEAIAGLRKAETGAIVLNGEDVTGQNAKARIKKRIGFIPEDRLSMGLVPGMTMEENRILKEFDTDRFSKHHILKRKVIKETVQDEISRYEIKTAGEKSPVSLMSGGNQQKLLVAREIGGDPTLLIAVYPSRGLDIGAAEAIHEILLEQCKKGVAVLLVSEELDELFQMADRIGVLCSGELMATLEKKEADYDTIGRLMSGERYEK